MAVAARVRVIVQEAVLNDPDHRAFTCREGQIVNVAGGWYAEGLIASGLVERISADAPASMLQSLAESEALIASLTPKDFTTPSGQPNPSAEVGEPELHERVGSEVREDDEVLVAPGSEFVTLRPDVQAVPTLGVARPVEAPQPPQDAPVAPKAGGTGGQLPGRISEQDAVRQRAGSKARR
jgi:hypothetical protein